MKKNHKKELEKIKKDIEKEIREERRELKKKIRNLEKVKKRFKYIENIQKRIFEINSLLCERLCKRNVTVMSSMDEEHRSGILSFVPPGHIESFYNFLIENNIIVSVRNGNIRVSPHFYNNDKDVSNFFDSLDRYTRGF